MTRQRLRTIIFPALGLLASLAGLPLGRAAGQGTITQLQRTPDSIRISRQDRPSVDAISSVEDAEIRFRRVEIPEVELERFADGLLPQPRQEFERLVADSVTPNNDFLTARYTATLSGDTLSGVCELRRATSSEEQTQYLVVGSSLPMSRPNWTTPTSERPAILGRHFGTTVVEAQQTAAELEFDWNLRGQAREEAVDFHFISPNALVHELLLSLPTNRMLRANLGVVERGSSTGGDTVLWTVRWSGNREVHLSLASEDSAQSKPRVHQDTTYQLDYRGMRVTSVMNLSLPQGTWPNVLRLRVDPSLSIIGARLEETPIRWVKAAATMGVTPDAEATGGPNLLNDATSNDEGVTRHQYVLPLPDQMTATLATLHIEARGDFPTGDEFLLPRIQHEATWTSEAAHLVIRSPLEITDVSPKSGRCREIRTSENGWETFSFDFDSPENQLNLRIEAAPVEVHVEAIVSMSLTEDSADADVELRFQPLEDKLFNLKVDVATASGWLPPIADSVEAQADTDVLQLRDSVLDRYEFRDDTASVRLRQAATNDRPVDLKFHLRNESFADIRTLADLVPISVPQATNVDIWLHSKDTPGVELLTTGSQHANWQRQDDLNQVPDWIRQRLSSSSRGMALGETDLLVHHGAGSELVSLVRRPRVTRAEISTFTAAVVGPTSTERTLTIRVDPQGDEIEHLELSFSGPVSGGAWTLSGRSQVPNVVRMEARDGDPSSRQRYRVSFEPATDPFALQFRYPEILLDEVNIPLVAVEGASSDGGIVVVAVEGPFEADLEAQEGLSAVPFAAVDTKQTLPSFRIRDLRACYSYNDTGTALPVLRLLRRHLPAADVLSCWRADLRSFFAEQGRPRHRAEFFLQNDGATQLLLRVPTECTLEDVEVDGKRLQPLPRLRSGLLSVSLPDDQPFPCVTVRYVEEEKSLRAIDWLRSPMLMTDVPTLSSTWQVWLPRDYRTYDWSDEAGSQTWLQRIVGPFADRRGPRLLQTAMRSLRRRLVPGANNNLSINLAQFESLLGSDQLGMLPDRSTEAVTWGRRIQDLKESMARTRPEFEVFVDRVELRRLGIFPETPMPATRPGRWRKMGTDRLVQAGLAVVVLDSQIILTSFAEAEQLAQGAELVDGVAIDQMPDWFDSKRVRTADKWNQERISELWQPSSDALEIGLQRGGWTAHRLLVQGSSHLKVYHRDTAIAIACGVFFVGLALGWRVLQRQRKRRWFAIMVLGFVAAILLPQPAAIFAAAFAWAVLLSGLTISLLPKNRPKSRRTLLPSTPQYVGAGIVLAAIFGPSPFLDEAVSRENNTTALGESLVYFPVDKNGNATRVVYLSPDLYRNLKQRKLAAELRPDFLIQEASYSADWPRDPQATSIKITAEYDVVSFVENARMKLPSFMPGSLERDSMRVNGSRLEAIIQDEKGILNITLDRPNDHRVSLVTRVPLTKSSLQREIRLLVPRVPQSRLQLNVPRELANIRVPTASGASSWLPGALVADLGPIEELRIVAEVRNEGEENAVDQLILLNVQENDITVETRFRFQDQPRPMSLRIDPRLVPISNGNTNDNVINDPITEWDSENRLLRVGKVDENAAIRFRLDSPTSIGHVVVPSVRPTDVEIRSRRLAVVTSKKLTASIDPSEAETLVPDDMGEQWESVHPEASLEVELGSRMPTLRIGHAVQSETWTCEVAYFFDELQTQFEATAQLSPAETDAPPSGMTIRKFKVPSTMHFQSITATSAAGVPLRMRWSRHSDTLTLFFLSEPSTTSSSPIDVLFKGKLEAMEGSEELPLIVPQLNGPNTSNISQSVRLYRRSDVALDVDPLATVDLSFDAPAESERNGYRFVGSWDGELSASMMSDAVAFAVAKRPAQRTLQGTLTTTLHHDDEGWWVDNEATVTSSDGIIDAVHFELPASLTMSPPAAFEGDTELRVDQLAGGPGLHRRIVTVWLSQGDSRNRGPRNIRLSTKLTQDQTELPNVRLLNVSLAEENQPLQHFVQLPLRSRATNDDSVFRWTPTGLATVT